MPSPDDRRNKALEDIARELAKLNKTLQGIERNTRRALVINYPKQAKEVIADDLSRAEPPVE